MANIFWDSQDVVLIDYLQKGRTIMGDLLARLDTVLSIFTKPSPQWPLPIPKPEKNRSSNEEVVAATDGYFAHHETSHLSDGLKRMEHLLKECMIVWSPYTALKSFVSQHYSFWFVWQIMFQVIHECFFISPWYASSNKNNWVFPRF